jgi:RNA polymerase sigma-70 factor, ECF subfamily
VSRGTDEELLAAFVGGDRQAYEELVRRYATRVYAICYRYFRNEADAEDATQETFVTLLRRGSTFVGGARLSTWMYRVATNTCNDLARKRMRRPRTVPLAGHDRAHPEAVEELAATRHLDPDLRRALELLEPAQREAVVLHDVVGLPYADIAVRSGVAVGTVKSRVHRGHARLAQTLRRLGDPVAGEPSAPRRPPTVQP